MYIYVQYICTIYIHIYWIYIYIYINTHINIYINVYKIKRRHHNSKVFIRLCRWKMNFITVTGTLVPSCLCQRLWSGNRSSYRRGTFFPDIKCLSAGHTCSLLTTNGAEYHSFASRVREKRTGNLLCLRSSSLWTSLNNLWYWAFGFDN